MRHICNVCGYRTDREVGEIWNICPNCDDYNWRKEDEMQIFLEGGVANGEVITVPETCNLVTLPDGSFTAVKYELTKPLRLWHGKPIFSLAKIELPDERLETLEALCQK